MKSCQEVFSNCELYFKSWACYLLFLSALVGLIHFISVLPFLSLNFVIFFLSTIGGFCKIYADIVTNIIKLCVISLGFFFKKSMHPDNWVLVVINEIKNVTVLLQGCLICSWGAWRKISIQFKKKLLQW